MKKVEPIVGAEGISTVRSRNRSRPKKDRLCNTGFITYLNFLKPIMRYLPVCSRTFKSEAKSNSALGILNTGAETEQNGSASQRCTPLFFDTHPTPSDSSSYPKLANSLLLLSKTMKQQYVMHNSRVI